MTSTAALARFAAICGLLVAPSAAEAQLRCTNPETDIQIRSVSFEGNEAFSDGELALHVVSTATDLTARFNLRPLVPALAVLGTGGGFATGRDGWDRGRRALYFGAGAFLLGAGIANIQGTERCLAPGTLSGDILNLSSFYRDQGFNDVRVDTTKRIDGRWAHVGFKVTEGRPVLVDSLSFVGFDTAAVGELPASFNSQKGRRYSPTLTQEDIDSLETRLRDRGYPEGRVDRDVQIYSSTYTAKVEFTITPGPRARIGTITVNTSTLQGRSRSVRENVIRSLLRFRTGDMYSERALFESERRFYRVGAFLSAEIAPVVSHVHTDSLVDVVVNVVEDLTHSFSVEPGFGTLDCFRLRSDYSEKAFLGGINRLDLSGSVSKIGLATANGGTLHGACRALQEDPPENEISSSAINYNATARLTRPLPLPGGLQPSLSAYTERRGGFQSYLRTTIIGGALSLSKSVTRTIFMDASYNLEYGHTDASETVLCFLFRACDASARDQLTQGDKRLAVAGIRFSRDRRNSADSASRGSVVRLELRAADRWLGSDKTLEFNKGVIDAAQYLRVGPGVVAIRARAGLIGGGQETQGARLPPPQERLYAGGETSVRGFRQSELGPLIYVTSDPADSVANALNAPDEASRIAALQRLDMRIIPAGGNAMYVGNLEYRLPGPFLKTLQTVFFVDAGAVTTTGITTIAGSNQFRLTPGVAFKYFSPVGPIQFNVGYNRYDPLAGPAFSDKFTDGAGNPILRCISGEAVVSGRTVCQPLPAIAPRSGGFLRRLTLTVSFPPDF